MKIKSILVSQPAPNESSPYLEMAKKEKIKIDFRPFIHVEAVDSKELRAQKIDLSAYTGIIFTSRNAVDHYFRLAEEMRFTVPDKNTSFTEKERSATVKNYSPTCFLCLKNTHQKNIFYLLQKSSVQTLLKQWKNLM